MSSNRIVKIGCYSAFLGDTTLSAQQLVDHVDYLVADYLAEITMVILARARAANSDGGYVDEFVSIVWKPLMKQILSKGVKVVTNAGGMNPARLKQAIEEACAKTGVVCPKVAAVVGDDIADRVDEFRAKGQVEQFGFLGELEPLWPESTPLLSCNAYFGAFPIAEALRDGAQVVVTGRCVDSALALGPLIYEFNWRPEQFDLLSSGSLAGHLIECGAQATGGNFTDWRESSRDNGWHNIGFPIVECSADGTFVITKPANTGGVVSTLSVSEQLVYEIGDGARYELPDVACDWRAVRLAQVGAHRVAVSGARGLSPSAHLKACVTYADGWLVTALLLIPGDEAAERARAVGAAIVARGQRALAARRLPPLVESRVDLLGCEGLFGANARSLTTREVVLRIGARHADAAGVKTFAHEIAPAATGMAPGICGVGGAKPTPAVRLVSCLVPKRLVVPSLLIADQPARVLRWPASFAMAAPPARSPVVSSAAPAAAPTRAAGPLVNVPLAMLCVGRSGDKGDMANIGLVMRDSRLFDIVGAAVTADTVARHMAHVVRGRVERYALPGISAYNFVCTRALGGGGAASLAVDRQGKTFAQQLLCMHVAVPSDLLRACAIKAAL